MKTFAAALVVLVIASVLALGLGRASAKHVKAHAGHHVVALKHLRALA
jgi:hypothetical protein